PVMKTCLVVEDSPLIREITARLLRDLGFSPREASRAIEGVAECKHATPDIVLLDWDLPNMEALDFLKGVAELAPEQRPIIILCATEYDQQQFTLARAAGAAHVLMKPYDSHAVAEKFAEIGLIARSNTVSLADRAVS
ncbi:MAG: response regulator, partial [Parvularculaceae bacterium]|nr:response regulator [Parvularculaceae bacterium]